MNKKIYEWLNSNPIVIASLLLMVLMVIFVPKFATFSNLMIVLGQMSYLGIATIGLSFVLIAGGNDLSIGSIISLSSVLSVSAMISMNQPFTVATGVIVALLTGLLIGLLNGIMVAYLRINAFMMTLITSMLFEGITLLITDAKTIKGIPDGFVAIGNTKILGMHTSVYIMLVITIISQFILTRTTYGRKLFATGANPRGAHLVGVKAKAMLLSAYLISGLFGGIAGLIMTCRLGVGSPSSGSNIIMEIMSAAIIGGNSLFGGKGTAVGAVFGALLLCLISNGLTLLGVEYTITMIIKGLIILGAVTIDMLNARISTKRLFEA